MLFRSVDTLTRGFLGLTVACARCHDHKFDPIPTLDYYALAGIFKSTKSMQNHKVVAMWNERSLVTKEIKVTLVLDCCFLAGMARLEHEVDIRYIDYDLLDHLEQVDRPPLDDPVATHASRQHTEISCPRKIGSWILLVAQSSWHVMSTKRQILSG